MMMQNGIFFIKKSIGSGLRFCKVFLLPEGKFYIVLILYGILFTNEYVLIPIRLKCKRYSHYIPYYTTWSEKNKEQKKMTARL